MKHQVITNDYNDHQNPSLGRQNEHLFRVLKMLIIIVIIIYLALEFDLKEIS